MVFVDAGSGLVGSDVVTVDLIVASVVPDSVVIDPDLAFVRSITAVLLWGNEPTETDVVVEVNLFPIFGVVIDSVESV